MPERSSAVTLRDVAARAGVSLKTASNVVNGRGRMSASTRALVEKTIADLGYKVNVSARNLSSGRTGVLSLALPTLKPPYMGEMAEEIIDAAAARGFEVTVSTYSDRGNEESRRFLRDFNTHRADGAILSLSEHEQITAADLHVGFPLVCLGSRLTWNEADRVTTDDVADAMAAAGYLIERGSRTLAVVGARRLDLDAARRAVEGNGWLRLRGVLDGLAAYGLDLDPGLVGVTGDNWTIGAGYQAMRSVLAGDAGFDGVVCFNDQLAIGAVSALSERKISVPDDVQVIGFDNIEEAQYLTPPLTTMDSNLPWIAATAVHRISEHLAGSAVPVETLKATSRVIPRGTTRTPSAQ